MRYAAIKKIEIENGNDVGSSLFVQGCPIHCKGCHNPETWDFKGGKEWTPEVEEKWFEHLENWYVKRVSILGGEPLAPENRNDVCILINKIKLKFREKDLWLYTGYEKDLIPVWCYELFDHIVAGPYVEELRDISLPFMGSSNQKIIECK